MAEGKASLSHAVIFCFDLPRMVDFYTRVLGFHLSDRGEARGAEICFLTLDPAADHHQIALCSGRVGPREGGVLNHLAFRVDGLPELRRRWKRLTDAGVAAIDPTDHGSWYSVYYRDVENNRMEFFADSPWYVKQPHVAKLDLGLSDAEILRRTEAEFGATPGFRKMDDWKAETEKTLAAT